MNSIKTPIQPSPPPKKRTWVALGALMSMLVASPALADVHRGDRDWHAHEVQAHRYWHGPHPAPGYVYAPPTVYAPPPASPGINLILPLHFN